MRNNLVIWLAKYLDRVLEGIEEKDSHSINERLQDFLASSSLSSIIESLLNDPNSDVRASTANLAGKIISIVGDDVYKKI